MAHCRARRASVVRSCGFGGLRFRAGKRTTMSGFVSSFNQTYQVPNEEKAIGWRHRAYGRRTIVGMGHVGCPFTVRGETPTRFSRG